MNSQEISIRTRSRSELVDITPQLSRLVKESKVADGLLVVFVPHTTAAVTINENADPDVQTDILNELKRLVPPTGSYIHSEGNSAAHIQSTLLGPSQTLLLQNGRLALGTWQGVYFCEFDGPRTRKIWVKIIGQ